MVYHDSFRMPPIADTDYFQSSKQLLKQMPFWQQYLPSFTGIHLSFTGCTYSLVFTCSPSRPLVSLALSCCAVCSRMCPAQLSPSAQPRELWGEKPNQPKTTTKPKGSQFVTTEKGSEFVSTKWKLTLCSCKNEWSVQTSGFGSTTTNFSPNGHNFTGIQLPAYHLGEIVMKKNCVW